MKIAQIEKMMKENVTNQLAFAGYCHDCGVETTVNIDKEGSEINISGGAVYSIPIKGDNHEFIKCDGCYKRDPVLKNWQPCEVYSRVVGYLRPVQNWNNAKKEEHKLRKFFDVHS